MNYSTKNLIFKQKGLLMENLGIEQYIEDDLKEGRSLSEALDRSFDELYIVFCNQLDRYGFDEPFYYKEDDVLALLEQVFKRKYKQ